MRLRDAGDASAWEEFVALYTPLIFEFCRRRGLQEADAVDVAQDAMHAVARAMERFEYEPQRGKFRSWLLTVVRSRLSNFVAGRQRREELEGKARSALELREQDATAEESEWEASYYRRLFHWAADRIRARFQESTWQAFWRSTIEERDGKDVAESLGMSVGAVYVAKARVIARLKQELQSVDGEEIVARELFRRA